ncbi:MAG TPA: hypothetical protein VL989_00405 [Candidatus Sulfotelmatobacter sp.]|nr:hypothetical protein [Candidatus Sulfotelmatobacter sp.]
MKQSVEAIQFLDPFAENGPEEFNPLDTYQQIVDRYHEEVIEHDDAADKFVQRTEALMLDTTFLGLMDQANQIAIMAHLMCDHNPAMQQSFENSALFGANKEDGHNHSNTSEKHKPKEDDEYEIGPDGKKRKKRRSWFGVYI